MQNANNINGVVLNTESYRNIPTSLLWVDFGVYHYRINAGQTYQCCRHQHAAPLSTADWNTGSKYWPEIAVNVCFFSLFSVTKRLGCAENASTGKRNYGKGKYGTAHFARMENASTENASTMQTFSQIKKSLVLHKLVWCIFKWGGQVDYRLFYFSDNVNNQK